jgi:hypothetical protein
MTEQPRNWDKELADVDRAIAKQQGPPAVPPAAGTPPPGRRFVALAWFWAVLAIVLAVALIAWPYDKSCGLRLIFFLGAALVALVMGVLGAITSWRHRQGVPLFLSLLVVLWAGVMGAREILPRAGYAKQALEWTCPQTPPVANPAPVPSTQ